MDMFLKTRYGSYSEIYVVMSNEYNQSIGVKYYRWVDWKHQNKKDRFVNHIFKQNDQKVRH